MSIRLALVCAVSLAALSSVAEAASNRAPVEIRVSTAGVNFSRPEAVATFYASLKRAARQACDSRIDHSLKARAADRACAAQMLDDAVRQARQPALTALHDGSLTPNPVLLAAQ